MPPSHPFGDQLPADSCRNPWKGGALSGHLSFSPPDQPAGSSPEFWVAREVPKLTTARMISSVLLRSGVQMRGCKRCASSVMLLNCPGLDSIASRDLWWGWLSSSSRGPSEADRADPCGWLRRPVRLGSRPVKKEQVPGCVFAATPLRSSTLAPPNRWCAPCGKSHADTYHNEPVQ